MPRGVYDRKPRVEAEAPQEPANDEVLIAIHQGVHVRMPRTRHPIQPRGTGVITQLDENGYAHVFVYPSDMMTQQLIRLPHISIAAPGEGWFVASADFGKWDEPPEAV